MKINKIGIIYCIITVAGTMWMGVAQLFGEAVVRNTMMVGLTVVAGMGTVGVILMVKEEPMAQLGTQPKKEEPSFPLEKIDKAVQYCEMKLKEGYTAQLLFGMLQGSGFNQIEIDNVLHILTVKGVLRVKEPEQAETEPKEQEPKEKVADMARLIRKKDQSWNDALKRAGKMMKDA